MFCYKKIFYYNILTKLYFSNFILLNYILVKILNETIYSKNAFLMIPQQVLLR